MCALNDFIRSVGGVTQAAAVLCVSGTIVHRWRRHGPSARAQARIALWLRFNTEHERFILRNVWTRDDRLWTPRDAVYHAWMCREFNALRESIGYDRAVELWKEIKP